MRGSQFLSSIHSRDFKIQRGDSNKNVAKKVNLRSFSLYSDYSYPLTLSNVGRTLLKLRFQVTISKLRKRNKFSPSLVTFTIKHETRHFHVAVVQKRERNYKKA